ncbi:MAG TPA: hypothetical protein VL135_13215 [Terracidiphilus sp.]|jgi:hypothetical protein|nr:hypothetical protein [Terracidiphilus sp.]
MRCSRVVLTAVLSTFAMVAFAQSDVGQKSPQSDAQKSFEKLKTLAGSWDGTLTTTPPSPEVQNKHAQVTLRVTSMGNAFLHEIKIDGRKDDPITMFYLDNDLLTLTHYCDAGNRPRMTGKSLPDGKTIDFEFLDIAGDPHYHMHHSKFTMIDADHHIEEWTFMVGDKPVLAHLDLQRRN